MDTELKQVLEAMERRAEQRDRELREYIDGRVQALREHIDERSQQLRRELSEYIDERTHDTETRIVRAFGAYQ